MIKSSCHKDRIKNKTFTLYTKKTFVKYLVNQKTNEIYLAVLRDLSRTKPQEDCYTIKNKNYF